MRIRRYIMALATTAVAAGCSADSTTGLALSESRVAVPLKGNCTTTSTAIPVAPGQLRILVNGQCQFTHLGTTRFFADQVANIAGGTLTGSNVFTAANGDQLFARNDGPLGAPLNGILTVGGVVTFTGGTGRFANASGQGQFSGEVNIIARTGTDSWEGMLLYRASDAASP
ncbi:MAG: hypothetical protein ABI889_08450 [Gemmatimonadota bacterium]